MEKISIYTESKFLPEKNYVFKVIFEEILGIEYDVFDTSVSQVYKLVLPDNTFIEFADDFFTYIPESIGYCDKRYLPKGLVELKNALPGEEVKIFYGSNRLTNHGKSLYCGADIIGSAFFMLTRWEEMISPHTDKYGRFPENEALAVKFGVIQKPLVHIYAELVRKFMADFGFEVPQKNHFTKILTHDVDFLYKWNSKFDFLKTCMGDIFKRLSVKALRSSIQMWKNGQDPYDTYAKLMTLSEQSGQKSIFYVLRSKRNEALLATEKGRRIIQSILNRNHEIAFHTAYFTEKDIEKFSVDKAFIEQLSGKSIQKSRQHFLKLSVPQTFRLLEKCGIDQDSSMYYSHFYGFRTGMCIEHSLFDCEKRKTLYLKELPLTVMDVSLLKARKYDEAIAIVDTLMETVKRYNGTFVCLWHNNNFNSLEWRYLEGLYEHIAEAK